MRDGLSAWKDGYRVALSLTFDDARRSQIDTAVPILDQLGVKATFYVSEAGVASRPDAWREAARDGHEVGNHTMRHPCSSNFPFARAVALEEYTLEEIRDDIDAADRFIVDTLGVRARTFGYPCGQTFVGRGRDSRSYVPVVAERFLAGRGYRGEIAYDHGYCDLSRFDAAGCDSTGFDELARLIDAAAATGSWLILCGHAIGVPDDRLNTDADVLRRVLDYVQRPASEIWVAPVAEVATAVLRASDEQAHREGVDVPTDRNFKRVAPGRTLRLDRNRSSGSHKTGLKSPSARTPRTMR